MKNFGFKAARTEEEFGEHIIRGEDGRIYSDAQSVVDVAPREYARFIHLRGQEIARRQALPLFLVPGRGAYFYFYALYPYLEQYASVNGLEPPRFLPLIARTYKGENQAEGNTEIVGLESYLQDGTIHEKSWVVVVEDLIDNGHTARGFRNFFAEHGLEGIKLDFLTDTMKLPRALELNPWLQNSAIYVRSIDAGLEPSKYDWKVQAHELSDIRASELLMAIRQKARLKGCQRLYELLCGTKAGEGLHTSEAGYSPNEMLLGGFALGRLCHQEFGLTPDIVCAIWPDHHFRELGIGTSAPAVPVSEYFRVQPILREALDAQREGRDANDSVEQARVEFGLITKGLREEFHLQTRKARPDEEVLLVANEMSPRLSRAQLEDMIGTTKIKIAVMFKRSGREADLWLHARY